MSFTHRLLSILLLFPVIATADMGVLQHDLLIQFNDENRSFTVRDRIVIHHQDAAEMSGLPDFSLNPKWHVTSLALDGRPADSVAASGYIDVPANTRTLEITYGGKLDESQWPYIVFLPADGWYPEAQDHRIRFKLTLDTPSGWSTLTQGLPTDQATSPPRSWVQEQPQQGIYLVAGPWHSYFKNVGDYRAGVLLIEEDAELSTLYLDATVKYLERYGEALGAYPYYRFTLVENKRQTGWGMPGFTLLGSRIIRLPFIINTSFPHEILHNWWGNGVFVNPHGGNWSEGLTTYLSDYLMRERRGDGRQYRLNTLIAWQDFAARGNDFPLSRFVGRHDRATQAVGYGKGMFLFHMLRRKLGDTTFMAGLRDFYSRFRFEHATFNDIQKTFEDACDCPLESFFSQWLLRAGAPMLRLESALPRIAGDRHTLEVLLSQSGDQPWRLSVPVRITDTAGNVKIHSAWLDEPMSSFTFELAAPAARIEVDPDIELFRALDAGEKPTTFSKAFGAEQARIVVADDSFSDVAKTLTEQYPGWRISGGTFGKSSNSDVLIVLGGDAAVAAEWFASERRDRFSVSDAGIEIEGVTHTMDADAVIALIDTVIVEGKPTTVLWIAARHGLGVADLLRRLSHYGRFSYAVFDTPDERAATTGQWRGEAQSLRRVFGSAAATPTVPTPPPLF